MTTRVARRPNGPSRSASRRPTSSTTARPTAQGIGRAWALHFGKIGGDGRQRRTGTSESYDPKATDYSALAQKIKASGADVVFIGAITGQGTGQALEGHQGGDAGHHRCSARTASIEKSWYDGAGAAGNGTYLTFGGVDISQLTGRRQGRGRRVQDRPQRQAAAVLHRVRQGRGAGRPRRAHRRPPPTTGYAVLKAVMGDQRTSTPSSGR